LYGAALTAVPALMPSSPELDADRAVVGALSPPLSKYLCRHVLAAISP
jgi:hypothetical protein